VKNYKNLGTIFSTDDKTQEFQVMRHMK